MAHFKMASFLKSIGRAEPAAPAAVQPLKKQTRSRRLKAPVSAAPPPPPSPASKKKRKKPIPTALREQVWIHRMGRVFEGKCPTTWCQNTITVFDFQSGHDIPESKGGPTNLENLIPLCGRCNLSMGNEYTFEQWCKVSTLPVKEEVVEIKEEPKKRSRFWCF